MAEVKWFRVKDLLVTVLPAERRWMCADASWCHLPSAIQANEDDDDGGGDDPGCASESGSCASESGSCATESGSCATESGTCATESGCEGSSVCHQVTEIACAFTSVCDSPTTFEDMCKVLTPSKINLCMGTSGVFTPPDQFDGLDALRSDLKLALEQLDAFEALQDKPTRGEAPEGNMTAREQEQAMSTLRSVIRD